MKCFRVELIAATPNPQQCVYAGMHQDYSEGFVAADRAEWPDETRAGETRAQTERRRRIRRFRSEAESS